VLLGVLPAMTATLFVYPTVRWLADRGVTWPSDVAEARSEIQQLRDDIAALRADLAGRQA
jgi:hypothetical protein